MQAHAVGINATRRRWYQVNPVLDLRQKLAMNRQDFAVALGVSYQALHAAESGYTQKLHGSICQGLSQLGLDAGRIKREYAEWRQVRRRKLQEQLAPRTEC